MTTWTEAEFIKAVGRKPEDDDMDRCNCKDAGKAGHNACGICIHGKPVFMCQPCFTDCNKPGFKRL